MDIFDYKKFNLDSSGLGNSIYGLLISPRTTTEIQKFIYGVSKSSDANITPLATRRGEMEKLGFIERVDYAKLRNVKFKTKFEPYIDYLKNEQLSKSKLILSIDAAEAILKILDSNWFRGFYSTQFILSQPDLECYRNNVYISKHEGNLKIEFYNIFGQIGCMLGNIGILSNSLSALYGDLDYEIFFSIQDIISANNFDELINKINNNDERIKIANLFMERISQYNFELPNFQEVRNGVFEETEPEKYSLYPKIFIEHLGLIPTIIPPEISNFLMRADRFQLTNYQCCSQIRDEIYTEISNKP